MPSAQAGHQSRRSRSSGTSHKFTSKKAVWLGEVEAPDEAAAMVKGAAEFKVPAKRLMAIRR
jgi:hypothetical protein